jgi:hypothetical protein
VEGGSGRSAEASPTAILQDTHSVEGFSLLKNSLFEWPWTKMASKRVQNAA